MSIWDGMRYGFAPIYWITIAGVPVVWIERSTGLTLPSGYTVEDGSLVIDDSAAVGVESINRDNGTAVSLALSLAATGSLLPTGTLAVAVFVRSPLASEARSTFTV